MYRYGMFSNNYCLMVFERGEVLIVCCNKDLRTNRFMDDVDGRIDIWMDRYIDGYMDRWMEKPIFGKNHHFDL